MTGGNANDYTYPTDPINGYDLDGRSRCWWFNPVCHFIHKEVVNVVALGAYGVYAAGFLARHWSTDRASQARKLPRFINTALLAMEVQGLAADMSIDRYKVRHNLGELSQYDEGPGSRVFLIPWHGVLRKLHLPEGPVWNDAPGAWSRNNRKHFDW